MSPAECWDMKQDILSAAEQADACEDQYEAFQYSETPQKAWSVFWANADWLNRNGIMEITELPESLNVSGDLDLAHTAITELPGDLRVGGSLHLNRTAITELPKSLTVGRFLYLDGTAITKLPDTIDPERVIW
jgi:hypothetical protein